MDWIHYLPIVFLIVIILAALLGRQRFPYRRQQWLFTKAEWRFYRSLKQATEPELLIFAKVRIADVLSVHGPKARSQGWWKAFTRISSKHVDFVLCRPSTGEILCAIELDDRSHTKRDRQQRDQFVNRAFAAAALPLLRIPTQRQYDTRELREFVRGALRPSNETREVAS
ncbi:uncharacterized protein DUF2726 [Modicisalibacter xianhensis]|uniref:Uncharacterized protein DUF2726 n=1 Tax=Modicisalibacter xianhensis TaxID=442341 RepID=A0A4R8FS92_9GAMM|nr:DUF2726 domain-containing protein [Halomonas xianhensis]TDX26795.1 uncharacterized protein DUF2726 [Halomonas xianhensis]